MNQAYRRMGRPRDGRRPSPGSPCQPHPRCHARGRGTRRSPCEARQGEDFAELARQPLDRSDRTQRAATLAGSRRRHDGCRVRGGSPGHSLQARSPIRSRRQFGWHVIKVHDRDEPWMCPRLDDVQATLGQELARQAIADDLAAPAGSAASIEILTTTFRRTISGAKRMSDQTEHLPLRSGTLPGHASRCRACASGPGAAESRHTDTKLDLMVAAFGSPGCRCRRLHPKSSTAGAPVQWCRRHLARGTRDEDSSSIPATPMSLPERRGGTPWRRWPGGQQRSSAQSRTRSSLRPPASSAKRCPCPLSSSTALPWNCTASLDADCLARRRPVAIMTTDTFPKGSSVITSIAGDTGDHHRVRQGLRHDCARTWRRCWPTCSPMPTLPAAVLQPLLAIGGRPFLQRHHRGQRHIDQRHAAALRHG